MISEDIPVEDETDEQIRARAAGRSQQPSAEALAKFEDYSESPSASYDEIKTDRVTFDDQSFLTMTKRVPRLQRWTHISNSCSDCSTLLSSPRVS